VNLANLLLAKGTARQAEVAIRAAMGASRARVVRQLLTESLLLATAGGAMGILLGLWGIDLLMSALPGTPFLPEEVGMDLTLLTYVVAVSTTAALVFGLTPALMASRVSLGESMKESGASLSVTRSRKRFRNGILVAQLALTVPLVLTCAIAFRQVRALEGVDFGFATDHLLTAQVDLPIYRYGEDSQQATFFQDAVQALESMPGTVSAAAGMTVPIGPGYRSLYGPVTVEGREAEEWRQGDVSGFQVVTPGFFRTLEAPLRSGRFFASTDGPTDRPVAVVNERMARYYWPGEDAVGKRLAVTPEPTSEDWITVVGVVADFGATFYGELPSPTLYLPQAQRPINGMLVVARTVGDPLANVSAFREAIRRVDPGVPVSQIRSGEIMMEDWLRESRVVASTLGLFGILALSLAVIGLYGMVSYSVVQRTAELGMRIVLGADRGAIRRSVMRSFLSLGVIGLTSGLVISGIVGIVMRSQIAFLRVPYISTVTAIVVILMGVVMLASYMPARKATAIEPVRALRCE
jgi:putative ABC transport system permease protein